MSEVSFEVIPMTKKKNPSVVTLYAKNPDVWESARRKARSRGISMSQYIEQVLKEANTRIPDGEYSAIPLDLSA